MKKRSTASKTYMAALSVAVASGALVAAVPAQSADAAVSFTDVSTNTPHAGNIRALAERGVIKGFTDGTFRPFTELKRGEATLMLAESLNLDTKNVVNSGFKDVKPGSRYYGAVSALKAKGVIDGFSDNSFRPDAGLTRSEIAKFLVDAYNITGSYADENPFVDVKDNKWYAKYVMPLYATGITKGKSTTTFGPDRGVGRGEFSTFIVRAENYLAKSDSATDEMRSDIRAIVEINKDYKDSSGKVIATAKFDKPSNLLTLKAKTPAAIDVLQGTGIFSDKLPSIGVTQIKIGKNAPVDVSTNYKVAKQTIINQLKDLMVVNGTNLSTKTVPVRLFASTTDGEKIWEDFNLKMIVETP